MMCSCGVGVGVGVGGSGWGRKFERADYNMETHLTSGPHLHSEVCWYLC